MAFKSDKLTDLQLACSAMAKHYNATATFEPKMNQAEFRLTVAWDGKVFYRDFSQQSMMQPNSKLYDLLEKVIADGIGKIKHLNESGEKYVFGFSGLKPASPPPANTPLGGPGNAITYDMVAKAYKDTQTTAGSTLWTGGVHPQAASGCAPTPTPKEPEKPFSIDAMYDAPKPSWTWKSKPDHKAKSVTFQQGMLDSVFEAKVAEKLKAAEQQAKFNAAPPSESTITKVKKHMDKAIEQMNQMTLEAINKGFIEDAKAAEKAKTLPAQQLEPMLKYLKGDKK